MPAHAMLLECHLSNASAGAAASLDTTERNALKAIMVEVMRGRTDDLSRPWRPGTLMGIGSDVSHMHRWRSNLHWRNNHAKTMDGLLHEDVKDGDARSRPLVIS